MGKEELFKIDVSWNIDGQGKIETAIKLCIDNNCNASTANSTKMKIGRYSFYEDPSLSIILEREDLTSAIAEFQLENQKNN